MQEHERLLEPKKEVSPTATATAAVAAAANVKVTTDFSIAAIMNAAVNNETNPSHRRRLSSSYVFKDTVISGELCLFPSILLRVCRGRFYEGTDEIQSSRTSYSGASNKSFGSWRTIQPLVFEKRNYL